MLVCLVASISLISHWYLLPFSSVVECLWLLLSSWEKEEGLTWYGLIWAVWLCQLEFKCPLHLSPRTSLLWLLTQHCGVCYYYHLFYHIFDNYSPLSPAGYFFLFVSSEDAVVKSQSGYKLKPLLPLYVIVSREFLCGILSPTVWGFLIKFCLSPTQDS